MPLSTERNTPSRQGSGLALPVAANARIFAGALVAVTAAGLAAPGSTAANLRAAGRAEETVDNTGGAAGARLVPVERGVFLFKNAGADAVTQADVLGDCFIVDDETVARTNGGGTRSRAGKVIGLEPSGVWVEIL